MFIFFLVFRQTEDRLSRDRSLSVSPSIIHIVCDPFCTVRHEYTPSFHSSNLAQYLVCADAGSCIFLIAFRACYHSTALGRPLIDKSGTIKTCVSFWLALRIALCFGFGLSLRLATFPVGRKRALWNGASSMAAAVSSRARRTLIDRLRRPRGPRWSIIDCERRSGS